MEQVERLRALPIFADVPEADLTGLLSVALWSQVAAGTTVMREGEEGSHLLVVVRGRFEVAVGSGPGRVVLGQVSDGELLGEAALFRRSVLRSAEVRALIDADVLRIDVTSLETLTRTGNAVPRAIEEAVLLTLARRILASRDVVTETLKSEEAGGSFFSRLKGLIGR